MCLVLVSINFGLLHNSFYVCYYHILMLTYVWYYLYLFNINCSFNVFCDGRICLLLYFCPNITCTDGYIYIYVILK